MPISVESTRKKPRHNGIGLNQHHHLNATDQLGFTAQALSAAVRAKRMFVLTGPSGENFYPAFFPDAKYDRPVLEKISKSLGGLSGGSKWEFFTTPKISLGNKTPLDALAKGKIEQVLITVAGFLEK